MKERKIVISGARQFNLKNISLEIPHQKMTVVTGLSGSGKSSLVIDTLFCEGRRRYLELVSGDLQTQIGDLSKPDVDSIEGLPPVFFVGGEPFNAYPRSTVGTVTEVQDLLRVLFSKVGDIHCYQCHDRLKKYTSHEIVNEMIIHADQNPLFIMAPLQDDVSVDWLRKEGFVRIKIENQILEIDQIKETKLSKASIVVDRLVVNREERNRLTESVEMAMKYGKGTVEILSKNWPDGKAFCREIYCFKCNLKYGEMSPSFFSFNSPYGACDDCHGLGTLIKGMRPCGKCHGMRLKAETLSVQVGSLNIAEIGAMRIGELIYFFNKLKFKDKTKSKIADVIIPKIVRRLELMNEVGISYLDLNRFLRSLSSGEIQRVRMVSQMALGLVGVLYIMDEPTVGLHPEEITKMIAILRRIKEQGNTLIVVEHDRQFIKMADYIVELGPAAGLKGGEVIASGTYQEMMKQPHSLTCRFLKGEISLQEDHEKKRPIDFLELKGVKKHNLKNIDVKIPLGLFCCITGVSGAGKSTLIKDVFCELLNNYFKEGQRRNVKDYCREASGLEKINKMIIVDDQWVVRSKRSTVATYTEIFDPIRMLFSRVPESRLRGYTDTRFSLNLSGGRCEACGGNGFQDIEMHLLPNFEVVCEVCQGQRFNRETSEIKYKGKNIAEILQMTVEEAFIFFNNIPHIYRRLEYLMKIGLNYIRLGQTCANLSSGEAQRMKLANHLAKRTVGHTMFIFDEPTRGLHLADIKKFLSILFEMRDQGHSILVIEHHLDVISQSDYIIDLGPGAGEKGGCIVGEGTPDVIAKNKKSKIGQFLSKKKQIKKHD